MSASDLVLLDNQGQRSLYVGPTMPDGLPAVLLEGLVRRRLVATGDGCPCGARLVIPNRGARRKAMRAGKVGIHVPVEHEPDCPAVSCQLEAYLSGGCS